MSTEREVPARREAEVKLGSDNRRVSGSRSDEHTHFRFCLFRTRGGFEFLPFHRARRASSAQFDIGGEPPESSEKKGVVRRILDRGQDAATLEYIFSALKGACRLVFYYLWTKP